MAHTRWIWGHSATIIKPAAPGAPVPTAISFSPSAPTIFDNASLTTFVSAVSVTMSDGSTFTGVLGFAAPNNDGGGKFVLSGANIVTNAAMPTGASTQSVTVFASQNGTAVTASLNVTVQAHGTGTVLTTLGLISAQTGVAPFTEGIVLREGQSIGPLSTNVVSSQVVIMRRWNDNSVKHAIVSGIQAFSQPNTPVTIQILDQAGAGGTNLTSANITTAAPSATVDLGAAGSVNLSSLLSSPIRTFVSGPQMVECHYSGTTSGGVVVFFHVRLYSDSLVWIRVSVDNGYVDITGSDKTYVATVTIGGTVVFTGSLTHYNHTRWTAEGWIGGNPIITPKHNITDLLATKLVPNYFMDTPPAAALNGLHQTYSPYGVSDINPNMPGTGPQPQIGLLPLWDSLFVTSLADSRAFNSVIANAKAINNFSIVWRGSSDNNLPCRPSIFPTHTVFGPGTGGGEPPIAGANQWDTAHHGSAGYLAYLLTGDYFHLETMQHQAGLCYLTTTFDNNYPISSNGGPTGTSRNLFHVAVRAPAWRFRTIGQLAAIAPSGDTVTTDFAALLGHQADIVVNNVLTLPGVNQLGLIYEYDLFQQKGNDAFSISMFMHWFMVQSFGAISDLEPLPSMTNWITARNWLYKIPVDMLGTGSAGTFCFSQAAAFFDYNFGNASPINTIDDVHWAADWQTVWAQTVADLADNGSGATLSCGNVLLGSSGSDPTTGATSFWANLHPAISLAVDHGISGAPAAYNRFIGAPNYSSYRNATGGNDFASTPIFGIQPRVSTSDALTNLLATMAPGTWKLASTFQPVNATLSSVVYSGTSSPAASTLGSISQMMNNWSGGDLDTANEQLIVWGGGHTASYFGNEVYGFRFSSLDWARLDHPSTQCGAANGQGQTQSVLSDGQPIAIHTYQGPRYAPNAHKMFQITTDGILQGGGVGISWVMDPSTLNPNAIGTWSQIAPYPAGSTPLQIMTAYHPTNGLIYASVGNDFGLYSFNPLNTAGAWTTVNPNSIVLDPSGGHQCAVIDPIRNYFVGLGNGFINAFDLSNGGAMVNPTTTGDQTAQSAANPGVAWYPSAQKIVAWGGINGSAGTADLWLLTPSRTSTSWAWVRHPAAAGNTVIPSAPCQISPGSNSTNGTYGRFGYDAAHNCFYLVNDFDQGTYIYKPDF